MTKRLRKNILRGNAVPRFTCKLVFWITRRRNMTKIHFGHIANFVIVIKHHPPVTGDTEVFKEHVTGEYIGGSQLLYRIAIVFNNITYLIFTGLLDK